MAVTGVARAGPSAQVLQAIASAANGGGVPFGYLFNQARIESRFDPDARAPTSSAAGLFQFTRQTWLAMLDRHGAEHDLGWAADAIGRAPDGSFTISDPAKRQAILDLRYDPAAAATMAAELASDNSAYLSQQLGRDIDSADLALAHFLGAEGAVKFLSALAATPATAAAPLFAEAAAANRSVFYTPDGNQRSLKDIYLDFSRRHSPQPAVPGRAGTIRRQEQHASQQQTSRPLPSFEFESMPARLSIPFAQAAYRRLAALDEASGR